jgi:hypothetical protein
LRCDGVNCSSQLSHTNVNQEILMSRRSQLDTKSMTYRRLMTPGYSKFAVELQLEGSGTEGNLTWPLARIVHGSKLRKSLDMLDRPTML